MSSADAEVEDAAVTSPPATGEMLVLVRISFVVGGTVACERSAIIGIETAERANRSRRWRELD